MRQRARELCRASSTIDYCQMMGLSSWEGLWSAFPGETPELATLRAWAPEYRRQAWTLGLADRGIEEPGLAEELADVFAGRERPLRQVVFPDVLPALDYLRQTHRLGLVTNGPSDLQRIKLKAAGLEAYFEAVVVSTEVGTGKPDPAISHHALNALDAQPQATTMVGDSLERDIAGARAARLMGVWLNRSGRDRGEGMTADAEIATMAALRDVL